MTNRINYKVKYFLDGRQSSLKAMDLRTPITFAKVVKQPVTGTAEHINVLQRYKNDWAKIIMGRIEVEDGENMNTQDVHIFNLRIDPSCFPAKSDIIIVDNYIFNVLYVKIPTRRSKGELDNLNFLEVVTKQITNLEHNDFQLDDSIYETLKNNPEETKFKSGDFPMFLD